MEERDRIFVSLVAPRRTFFQVFYQFNPNPFHMEAKTLAAGSVVQIVGPVIDVQFPSDSVPDILDALVVKDANGEDLVLEVQQHLGENRVRAIAMDATEGIQRGTEVKNTGQAIAMPTGEAIRGRLFKRCWKSDRRSAATQIRRYDDRSTLIHLRLMNCPHP